MSKINQINVLNSRQKKIHRSYYVLSGGIVCEYIFSKGALMNLSICQSLQICPIPSSIVPRIQTKEFFMTDVLNISRQILSNSTPNVHFHCGWIEIVFFYCRNPSRWRFMGSSVNVQTDQGVEELASSMHACRNSPQR